MNTSFFYLFAFCIACLAGCSGNEPVFKAEAAATEKPKVAAAAKPQSETKAASVQKTLVALRNPRDLLKSPEAAATFAARMKENQNDPAVVEALQVYVADLTLPGANLDLAEFYLLAASDSAAVVSFKDYQVAFQITLMNGALRQRITLLALLRKKPDLVAGLELKQVLAELALSSNMTALETHWVDQAINAAYRVNKDNRDLLFSMLQGKMLDCEAALSGIDSEEIRNALQNKELTLTAHEISRFENCRGAL